MWFTSNQLALNFDKTQYMEFRPTNYYNVTTKVNYDYISLTNVTETKFLFYFLVLHPAARNTTILNESTSFRNQTMCVLFIILYCTTCFGL
jgi:hypothetical protein